MAGFPGDGTEEWTIVTPERVETPGWGPLAPLAPQPIEAPVEEPVEAPA